ncbi:LytTR family DNA-binding domain-containing protein [Sphingobacterium faecium]|uniref:LytTR family DNA-binding domain-containing protein n=1 Tax=Sphingobacterium faecium TaxID=34087 RepID=UPI003207D10D
MNKIIIKTKGKTLFIAVLDILFCRAAGAYSVIVLNSGEEIVNSINLLTLKNRLEPSGIMFRVSQSYLINMIHITCIYHSSKEIELSNTTKVPYTVSLKDLELELLKFTKNY